jgi:hypothetical protein
MQQKEGTFQILLNSTIDPKFLTDHDFATKRLALVGFYELTITKFVFATNKRPDFTAIHGLPCIWIQSPQLTNQVCTDSPGPLFLYTGVEAAYISSTNPQDSQMGPTYRTYLHGQIQFGLRVQNPTNANQWGNYFNSYWENIASDKQSCIIEISYKKLD